MQFVEWFYIYWCIKCGVIFLTVNSLFTQSIRLVRNNCFRMFYFFLVFENRNKPNFTCYHSTNSTNKKNVKWTVRKVKAENNFQWSDLYSVISVDFCSLLNKIYAKIQKKKYKTGGEREEKQRLSTANLVNLCMNKFFVQLLTKCLSHSQLQTKNHISRKQNRPFDRRPRRRRHQENVFRSTILFLQWLEKKLNLNLF